MIVFVVQGTVIGVLGVLCARWVGPYSHLTLNLSFRGSSNSSIGSSWTPVSITSAKCPQTSEPTMLSASHWSPFASVFSQPCTPRGRPLVLSPRRLFAMNRDTVLDARGVSKVFEEGPSRVEVLKAVDLRSLPVSVLLSSVLQGRAKAHCCISSAA